jgi:hypothetical protein
MNYVKHLSMALLVLGTASVFASEPASPVSPAVPSTGIWDKVKTLAANGTVKGKEVFSNYVYGKATWKTQLPLGLVLVAGGYGLYKKSSKVKDFVDDSLESAGEGIRNIKDGNGNARRNAGLTIAGLVAAGYVGDRLYNGKWRFIS